MKKLIFISFSSLLLSSAFAETKIPNIKKGEVKITFNCEDFPTPSKKVDEELITFSDDQGLKKAGLILRSRKNVKQPEKSDVTIKFRPASGDIVLDKALYDALKKKDDAKVLKLKCESDVSEGPTFVESCSLTTVSKDLGPDHQSFAIMTTGSSVKPLMINYPTVQVSALSWEISDEVFEKIAIEKWVVKNKSGKELCLLEASAKFEVEEDPKNTLKPRLKTQAKLAWDALAASKAFVGKGRASIQGNKTGRALDFANNP